MAEHEQEPSSAKTNLVPDIVSSISRAGLNIIPGGGALASVWADWESGRRFQRIEETLQDISARLACASEQFLPESLDENQQYLLEVAVRYASEMRTQEKRKQLVSVLESNWVFKVASFDESILFLKAVNEFDETHMQILKVLLNSRLARGEAVPVDEIYKSEFEFNTKPGFKFSVFMPAMNKLAAEFGFISRDPLKPGQVLTGINTDGLTFMAKCKLRSLGLQFLRSLKFQT